MTEAERAKEILEAHRNQKSSNGGDSDIIGLGKLGDTLTDSDKILMHSIFGSDMPPKIAVLDALNCKLESKIIRVYRNSLLMGNVSVKGQGRKDILSLAKSLSLALGGLVKGDEGGGWKSIFRRGDDV